MNFQIFKLDLEPEIKLPQSIGSWKEQKGSRKNIYFIDYTQVFVRITANCEKFIKR